MIKKKTKKATMIPPTVTACAEVRLLKESPTQQQFGYCTKSQAMMAIGAAGLIGSRCALDVATEIFGSVNGPVSDAAFAILHERLQEHDSLDVIEQLAKMSDNGRTITIVFGNTIMNVASDSPLLARLQQAPIVRAQLRQENYLPCGAWFHG